MEITEYKTTQAYVTVGYRCDGCGLHVDTDRLPKAWHCFKHVPKYAEELDICDMHVCSPKCFVISIHNFFYCKYPLDFESIAGMDMKFAKIFADYLIEK